MELKYFIQLILSPGHWKISRLYPVSKSWDEELTQLMTKERFKTVGNYTAKIGKYELWIANHPVASFRQYPPIGSRVLPASQTAMKCWTKLRNECGSKLAEQYEINKPWQESVGEYIDFHIKDFIVEWNKLFSRNKT